MCPLNRDRLLINFMNILESKKELDKLLNSSTIKSVYNQILFE
jgi:hypothetical protein